jgi:hypothetical protein
MSLAGARWDDGSHSIAGPPLQEASHGAPAPPMRRMGMDNGEIDAASVIDLP